MKPRNSWLCVLLFALSCAEPGGCDGPGSNVGECDDVDWAASSRPLSPGYWEITNGCLSAPRLADEKCQTTQYVDGWTEGFLLLREEGTFVWHVELNGFVGTLVTGECVGSGSCNEFIPMLPPDANQRWNCSLQDEGGCDCEISIDTKFTRQGTWKIVADSLHLQEPSSSVGTSADVSADEGLSLRLTSFPFANSQSILHYLRKEHLLSQAVQ